MVALLKSKRGHVRSNVKRLNTIGATRDHVAFDYDGFHAFRDETILQKWPLSAQTILSKMLILSMG